MAMCSGSGVSAQLVLQTAMSLDHIDVLITAACSAVKPSLSAMHSIPCERLFALHHL